MIQKELTRKRFKKIIKKLFISFYLFIKEIIKSTFKGIDRRESDLMDQWSEVLAMEQSARLMFL
jgi:hypothetical protein